MATTIEARVGQAMLKAERRAGHVGRSPLSARVGGTLTAKNPVSQKQNAIELAAYLVDSPCMGRVDLAKVFKCSKETIGARATLGQKMGLIIKIRTKSKTCGQPRITYVAANNVEHLTIAAE